MNTDADMWKQLGKEIEEGIRRNLGSEQVTRAEPRRITSRTRGGARTRRAEKAMAVQLEPIPVVIVEVRAGEALPSEHDVHIKLQERLGHEVGDLDIYYVIERHWAGLGPRELNPWDEQRGRQDALFLRNLKPQYILTASAQSAQATWCDPSAQVIPW